MAVNSVNNAINKVKATATIQKVFGWIIALFNGLIAFVGATQISEAFDVVMVLFFAGITALGVMLILKGNKKIKLIKTFHDYSARLSSDPEKSIDLLAASTGATVEATTKNILDMISVGFFQNCYVDTQHNKLIMNNQNNFQQSQVVPTQPQKAVKYVTVQCKGCGATNKIASGSVGECEFCGSQISE